MPDQGTCFRVRYCHLVLLYTITNREGQGPGFIYLKLRDTPFFTPYAYMVRADVPAPTTTLPVENNFLEPAEAETGLPVAIAYPFPQTLQNSPLILETRMRRTCLILFLAAAVGVPSALYAGAADEAARKHVEQLGGIVDKGKGKDAGKVVGVTLGGKFVTDNDLKPLAGLKNLKALRLMYTNVKGPGLKELTGLKTLQSLYLSGSPVSKEVLNELSAFKELTELVLAFTPATDETLKHLAGLEKLAKLDLSGTKVTDAGLKELAGLKNLESLYLAGTAVTDAGLK